MRIIIIILLLACSLPAQADWTRQSRVPGGPLLIGASSPDGQHLFTIGFTLTMNGFIPEMTNYVFASDNGGQSLTDITGNIPSEGLTPVTAIYFASSQLGFVGVGTEVYKTIVGGTTWVPTGIACSALDIHFHDLQHGVVACANGVLKATDDSATTWNTLDTGVGVDLQRMFWTDTQHGWIAANDETEDMETGEVTCTNGVVLRTSDGGTTWETSNTFPGRCLGELFFLDDHQTGWLIGQQPINAVRREAYLYKTTDDGQTFTDMGLPLQVGTLQAMIPGPLHTWGLVTMVWADENHGHLGGTAFIVETNSSEGGNKKYWRNVDYVTTDGGATWDRTDLGTIEVDLFGGTPPDNDGKILAGVMTGLYSGWMVGEDRAVWRYDFTCTTPDQCGANSTCENGTCVPLPTTDDGGPASSGGDSGTTDDGGPASSGGDSGTTYTGRPKSYEDEGGCSAAGPSTGLLALMFLAFGWLRRRDP